MSKIIRFYKTLAIVGFVFLTFSVFSQDKWEKKKKKFRDGTDQGMSSATHEKYVGQIVFSNVRIDKDNPDESSFKTTFKANENLYGRVYMEYSASREPMFEYYDTRKKTIEEPCDYNCGFAVVVARKETGEQKAIRCADLVGDELKWTSIQLSLYPDPLNGDPEEPERTWVYWMRELPPGKHDFTVTYLVGDGGAACDFRSDSNTGYATITDPMSVGEFTIVKEEEMEIPFRMKFSRYESEMDLSDLSADILDRANSYSRQSNLNVLYTDVTIIEQWEYERNAYNDIIKRTCDARIYGKDQDGRCAAYPFTVIQDHIGGGQYGQVKVGYQSYIGKRDLDCD